eukprot:3424580-Ditylum_brightwellii.AAC.1
MNAFGEVSSDMKKCGEMLESKPTNYDDMYCDGSSTKDSQESSTFTKINNVQKSPFGGHWIISGAMYKGSKYVKTQLLKAR